MKCLKIIAVLGILLFCISITQLTAVKAAPPPQILSVTPIDQWGHANPNIYRGQQSSLILVYNSQVNGIYQVYVTLTDANNVPVAFAATGNIQLNGSKILTLNLQVSSSAFVGVGKCIVVVTDQNYQSVVSFNEQVYIGILGDLNLDGAVSFQDLTSFVDAYIFYNHNFAIPSNYKSSDINGDGKIDFVDLTIFATAYVAYWNS
jgi:hypothetical protein